MFVRQHVTSIYRARIVRRTFRLAGKEYAYWIHPLILDNERAVEVALAHDLLQRRKGSVLEIGNVLSQNRMLVPRDVVDKYEQAAGVINEDVVTFSPGKKYDAIVSLSTLEHVGWDEEPREPDKLLRAIAHLKTLLTEDGELLATLPLGYNSFFDALVRQKKTGFSEVHYLIRYSASNRWREGSLEEAITTRFGTPYPFANAIVVGYYRKPNG